MELVSRFGLALVIGILVGLQREYAFGKPDRELFAGARTFALIALLGCTAGLVAEALATNWAFIAIFLAIALLIGAAYFVSAWRGEMGLTTETAAIITFLVGGLCYWGYLELAAALGVATAVLLTLKVEVRRLVRQITQDDVYATLKFAVITAIVLPLLPNRTYGPPPLDVLNPQNIWLMVVFISGISFFGYILIKIVGPKRGIGLIGLLGGMVSSTAVTLSFTQRSREQAGLARAFSLAITVAWTVMFARVLVVSAVLNARLLAELWLPLTVAGAVGLAYCGYLYLLRTERTEGEVSLKVPFELGPAIKFGLLYALILVVSKAAQMTLGDPGVYISAVASGAADVDAVILSMAKLSRVGGSVEVTTAARAVIIAVATNTAVKGGIVMVLGSPSLRRVVLPGLAALLATALSFVFLL